uniref:Poly(A) binding protein interacting protein 2B n=1 Tax=Cyanoderma ruficeps TaxID=181631 RepID=A0A8C3R777_9PASS
MAGSERGGPAGSSPTAGADPGGKGPGGKDQDPFADYLWMENEEDFDRQVEEELQEQEFLDRCFQEMLEEEEERDWFIPARDLPQGTSKSTLNPDAQEFVPGVKYRPLGTATD